ncbi:MAG: ATP-binding protein [Pseudomonadota bacterium]
MYKQRYLKDFINKLALERYKMAFISGPRQCGKTVLSKMILNENKLGSYNNWDDIDFRRIWTKNPKLIYDNIDSKNINKSIVVLDEIHKERTWKNRLKGLFDTKSPCKIIVTGSARLNVYKKGGDSLMGRYLNFRLHPFTVGELHKTVKLKPNEIIKQIFKEKIPTQNQSKKYFKTIIDLMNLGGFPEPFLEGSEEIARIWRSGRHEKIVREDLRDLSRISELSKVEMLMTLLPAKVSNPMSIQSLREDLEVAHETCSRWLNYLKELYFIFELKPYYKSISRSLKKEEKIYLWDWSELKEKGALYENMLASHLLKSVHFWNDTGKGSFDLHYLRDKEKREIDFLITNDKLPWLAIEAKLKKHELDNNNLAFIKKVNCKHYIQLVLEEDVWDYKKIDDIEILFASADSILPFLV